MAIVTQNKKLVSYILTSLGAVLLSVILCRLDGVNEIENRIWDWRVKVAAKYNEPDPGIKLIEVDQRSLDEQSQAGFNWPWPRSRYVKIIEFLELAGAKGLAFDILFTENSSYGTGDDKLLSDALKSKMPILHIVALSNSQRDFDESLFETFAEKLYNQDLKTGYSDWLKSSFPDQKIIAQYQSVIFPIPLILQNGLFFGNASAEPDSDGVMRHVSPGAEVRGVSVLNSPFAFYDLVSADLSKNADLNKYLDENGKLAVNFRNPKNSYSAVSADAVIKSIDQMKAGETPLIDPKEFRGSLVYLGLTAPGLFDLKPTPLDKKGKAVEFLANVLDNLINNNFIIKTKFYINILISLVLAFIIATIIFYQTQIKSQVFFVSLTFLLFIFCQFYAAICGYWTSFTMPFFAGLFSTMVSLTLQFYLEGRQHRFIRNAFRFYVSPSLIDEIVKRPETLSLGGEKKELSIFFSDIAGFTSISEKLEVTKLVSLMNSFLSEMTGIIQSNQGTVDKYIGDAIVAFWNAPLEVLDHAYLSVKTALDCQAKLKELNIEYQKNFGVDIKLRVGINTANVSVGNFGSHDRFSYTVIGDGVNLASRIEGVNKAFNTYILITEKTKNALSGRISCRRVASIRVVGRNEAVIIHEPYLSSAISETTIRTFEKALQAFENRDFKQALNLFKSIESDPVSRAYINRLESEINKGEDSDWSPVWELTSK